MINFTQFEKRTGITFKNKNLLKQAFVHRSYLNENPKLKISHNERLEFLGDAVLELVVTDFLFNKYSNKAEGELTSLRSALVNTITISQVATELKMNDFLLLSKGETKDAGKARQYILANTFEAFIGAVYLDQGYQPAQKFIKFNLLGRTNEIVSKGLWRDAKSLIQEKAQEYIGITHFYQVIDEEGPDHNKKFTVGIYFDKELMAEGRGDSKQEAEQQAAQLALKVKNWE